MPEERRQNDILILEKLDKIQEDISKTKIDLALNTQETTRLADYQRVTNGKVAAHEARLQSIEGANAITSTTLAEIKQDKKKREDNRSVIYTRIFWAIAGAVMVLAGRVLTYLEQNDFFKHIIK